MLNFFRSRPSIVLEAQKARFKPNFIIQLLVFIAVFIVTQIASALPVGIAAAVRVIADMASNRISMDNQAAIDPGYIANMMSDLAVVTLFCTFIATGLTIIYCRYIEGRSLYSMGFVRQKAISDYFMGLLVGMGMFSVSVLLAWITGALEYKGFVLGGSLGLIILFFIGFLFQGMSEEALLRGYLMVSIASKKPILLAVLANSILFSLMHLLNSGITLLSIINLTLFGIFASVYTLKADSIWGICAIHSAWNFTQGNVFGILVSGIKTDASVWAFTPTAGNLMINGGNFGLEGGLAVTVVLTAAIVITLLVRGRTVQNIQTREVQAEG